MRCITTTYHKCQLWKLGPGGAESMIPKKNNHIMTYNSCLLWSQDSPHNKFCGKRAVAFMYTVVSQLQYKKPYLYTMSHVCHDLDKIFDTLSTVESEP